jgi:small-conductance mechanosensitive channel
MNTSMTGKELLDALAAGVDRILSNLMERLFGPGAQAPLIGHFSRADAGVLAVWLVLVLLVNALAASWVRRKIRQAASHPESREWRSRLFSALGKPFYFAIWIYGGYLAVSPFLQKLGPDTPASPLRQIVDKVFDLGVFLLLFWIFFALTRVLEVGLAAWTSRTKSKLDDLVVPLLARSLRIIVPVVGIVFALPVIGLPQEYATLASKGSGILIIGAVAWILSQAVRLGEKAVMAEYDIKAADNLQARKVYTQVHVISKTLYVLIAIFTVASVLMLFDEVRRFGTSILASAGVVGVILGFAAQRTIANLFAGFQLAMTQPIRIDDVVIVEGEWGRVEEISLTYVVIHIWDDRRLVVPLSYFIEKPFQNWTRVSAALLGSVFLWVDYTLSLAEVRKAVQRIVEGNPKWDRRFWNLQVTDASERAMQIRVLATAADSSQAWDLRCEIREQLIAFIQDHCPQSLPRLRADLNEPQAPRPGAARSASPAPRISG